MVKGTLVEIEPRVWTKVTARTWEGPLNGLSVSSPSDGYPRWRRCTFDSRGLVDVIRSSRTQYLPTRPSSEELGRPRRALASPQCETQWLRASAPQAPQACQPHRRIQANQGRKRRSWSRILDDDRVPSHLTRVPNPAWRTTLARTPLGRSLLGSPLRSRYLVSSRDGTDDGCLDIEPDTSHELRAL